MKTTTTSYLFVYGTLREGGRLAPHWLPARVFPERIGASLRRFGLYVPSHRSFPVLAEDVVSSTHGEVVCFDPSDPIQSRLIADVVNMETSAGYELRLVTVALDGGTEVEAYAFVWPYSVEGMEPLFSGDWIEWHAADQVVR